MRFTCVGDVHERRQARTPLGVWLVNASAFKHACSIWNRTRGRVLLIPAMAGKSNQAGLSERCMTVNFTKCEVRKVFLAVRWGWI